MGRGGGPEGWKAKVVGREGGRGKAGVEGEEGEGGEGESRWRNREGEEEEKRRREYEPPKGTGGVRRRWEGREGGRVEGGMDGDEGGRGWVRGGAFHSLLHSPESLHKCRVIHACTLGFARSEGRGDLSQHLLPSSAAREIGDGDLRVGVEVVEQLQRQRETRGARR